MNPSVPIPGGAFPSRRDFLTLGVGAFALAAFPWARTTRDSAVRRTIPVMGTFAELTVVHRDPRHAQGAIDAAFAELLWVDATMTRFRADSDVGRVNGSVVGSRVAVSAATATVIGEALHWAAATSGRFDPALARASAIWDIGNRHVPPPAEDLRRFTGSGLYHEVELVGEGEGKGGGIVLHRAEAGIDLGGIAKGYGVDRAIEVLRAWGIRHALLSVGGDLYALGRSPAGDPWEIGIRSPDDPEALVATRPLEDAAIATSGDYESFFDYAGKRYHHLLDPETAAPRRSASRSVTIVAPTCMAADAAATAVFGCASDEAASLLEAARRGAELSHLL